MDVPGATAVHCKVHEKRENQSQCRNETCSGGNLPRSSEMSDRPTAGRLHDQQSQRIHLQPLI